MPKENQTQRNRGKIQVLGTKACGSVIAEAFLTMADLPFIHIEVDYENPGPTRDRLLSLNALGQVPTLLMPDGSIITETLAVAVFADRHDPELRLLPHGGEEQNRFWRWATFLVTAIYPTWTYGDNPKKWVTVGGEEAAQSLRYTTDEWRKKLLLVLESEANMPSFLASGFSAIDIYIAAFRNWRPGREWFRKHCPKLDFIADNLVREPNLKFLFDQNFAKPPLDATF